MMIKSFEFEIVSKLYINKWEFLRTRLKIEINNRVHIIYICVFLLQFTSGRTSLQSFLSSYVGYYCHGGLSRDIQPNFPFRKSLRIRSAACLLSPLNSWNASFSINLQAKIMLLQDRSLKVKSVKKNWWTYILPQLPSALILYRL